jgi:UDP-N-acetylglucosamine transferase subunit ALG13
LIFVTVGTQLPFDRMIRAIDDWARDREPDEVFAQIGPAEYLPRAIEYARFISPAECRERMLAADVIVAHAGMGSILSALELGKPILVMPRLAELGEHRNDHQLATAERLAAHGQIDVAQGPEDLAAKLDQLDLLATRTRISPFASDRLIHALSSFINS